MVKALSPIISVTLLVVISLTLASLLAPWMYELVTTTTNETTVDVQQQIRCRKAGLDFDSQFKIYGADWNFTGNGSDWVDVKIVNTGNIDLFDFSFELTLDSQSGAEIQHYDPTSGTQMTVSYPLRPSSSTIIRANITQDINDSISTLKSVKVLNAVCKDLAPSLVV